MSPGPDSKHILKACFTSRNEGVVELYRDWKASRTPPISMEGRLHGYLSLFPLPPGDFARVSGYFMDEAGKIVFVFEPPPAERVEAEAPAVYVAGSFNGWQQAVGQAEWALKPERVGGRACLALRVDAERVAPHGECAFKFVSGDSHWYPVNGGAPNAAGDGLGNLNYACSLKATGRHRLGFILKEPIDYAENYFLLYHTRKDIERVCVQPGDAFFKLRSSKELGAVVEDGRTVFRIFAPRAKWVKVGFFKDSSKPEAIHWLMLKRADDFVWEAAVDRDIVGWYYWFRLDGPSNELGHFDPAFRILDPYAKAAVSREGPGIVVDDLRHGLPPEPFKIPQWQDLVVLEAHARDLVAKAPGLRLQSGESLGFRHLTQYARRPDFYPKRLGVNAIELLPVQENDSATYGEYHWGYMTANFFAPASQYAAAPAEGSQIAEFRDLVSTLHDEGFAVILDVVYNHVGEPAHLLYVDKLYYFHLHEDGSPTNWSGCGNDLRCDAPMALRLIVDSLKRFVTFYGVDGFRFDLADLVGKPALQVIERELKAIRPDIILIAEPWSFRGHIGAALRDTGYASWNDGYRDYLKRYVRCETGWEAMRYFLTGSPGGYASWPAQSVNYVESHDDRTWIDDITENGGYDGSRPTPNDEARTRLMAALLLMSIGMPMLHAGMDFMASKGGVRNTYRDGDRNALDYRRAIERSACAKYFADWVAFRLSESGSLVRHYTRAQDDFYAFVPGPNGHAFACVYNASGAWGSRQLLFAVNPCPAPIEIDLGPWGALPWRQVADHERFLDPRSQPFANRPEGSVFLPATACGLWERDGVGEGS